MKSGTILIAGVSMFALAACGSEEKSSYEDAAEKTEAAAAEAGGDASSAASDIVETVKEKAEEVAASLELDMSSLDSFQSSLASMKGSLSGDQQEQLSGALAALAKDAVGESKGGALGAVKDLASGKSTEEVLFEKMASQLDGKSFEDILKLAG